MDCLIGYTGFVGSNLLQQRKYDFLVNSKNCEDLRGKSFSRVVCAGVSAVKWKANADPDNDWWSIQKLINVLEDVKADQFILISTIDVYAPKCGIDESYDCHNDGNCPYGKHRLAFEDFCKSHFPNCLVVRLPGLFGNGLKKNVIFDMLNNNCLDAINPKSSFQYYCLDNLSDDIDHALAARLNLVNLFTEPIETSEIADKFFNGISIGSSPSSEGHYDVWTKHASLRGLQGNYMYTKQEVLDSLEKFISNEKAKKAVS